MKTSSSTDTRLFKRKIKMRLLGRVVYFFCVIWSSFTLAGDFDLNGMVTDEVSSGVKASYKKIDAKLNEQYKILMRNPEFSYKKLLGDGERAWIKYRDVRCDEVGKSMFAGALAELAKERCLISITSSRVTELVYIETGVNSDGFHRLLPIMSRMASMNRDEFIATINTEGTGAEEGAYIEKNCELTALLHKEDRQMCNARMRFQGA